MLLRRTIGGLHRLAYCAVSTPIQSQELRHCIDRRIGPLWDCFDAAQGARDMATMPRRSTRNKEQAVIDNDAGNQVLLAFAFYLGQSLYILRI